VAAGRFDAYWERGLKPWDVAAGYLIVKESGGFVTSIDNQDDPIYSGNIVAGNEAIYSNIHKILKDISKA
jgi:myo-inositol-1(or 4)-monophosphatase